MTNNGSAALSLLDLPSSPAEARPEDRLDPATLRRVGEVTAAGVLVLIQSIKDWSAEGAMAGHTRERGGELLATLYELQQTVVTDDFPSLMYACGKEVLLQRSPDIFRELPGDGISKAPFDRGLAVMVDHLCAVLKHVTESERVYQLAMAN